MRDAVLTMTARRYAGQTAEALRAALVGSTSRTEQVMVELLDHIHELTRFTPTHRHYKGGVYQLLHRGEMEADLRQVVIYRDPAGRVWVRDSVDFFTTLPGDVPRFATIKPSEVG